METVAVDNELVAIGGPTAITCNSGSSWLNVHKYRFYTFLFNYHFSYVQYMYFLSTCNVPIVFIRFS